MAKYLTRHADGFILTAGKMEPIHCPYVEFGYPDYVQKRAALSAIIGTNQYLWARDVATGFRKYEMIKPVEWLVQVAEERLIGYVDEDRWFRFLQGQLPIVDGCFTKDRPTNCNCSVLLPFPLRLYEVLRRKVYRILNPNHASLIEDRIASQAGFDAEFKGW
jgi:hypothetical protein